MIENVKLNKELWGNPNNWEDDGHEWSSHIYNGTEDLWVNFIEPRMSKFIQGDVLEIACGYGRITEKVLNYPINLAVIDLNQNCINRCVEKFGSRIQNYFVNDGISLSMIDDNTKDFIFSWDSFVHMTQEVIEKYVQEIQRTLKINGIAWIHHSNLMGGMDNNFKNLGGRSNMSAEIMKEIISKNNLEVISQEYFKWSETIDIITIFKKKENL
jgi:ubiquinone/menaquinone biosynthesis C-methylase UbiE